MQNGHGLGGNQGGLFGRLGQYGIAGGQGSTNLAGENGQREVPGADTNHWPQWAMHVFLEVLFNLFGVITQEINRLAHLGNCIGQGLACFPDNQPQQDLHIVFH